MSVAKPILALLSLCAALSAAGCATEPPNWALSASPREVQVEKVALNHVVSFLANSAEPAPGAERRLGEFLAQAEITYGDRIGFDAGPQRGDPGSDELAEIRLETVRAMLRRHRVAAWPSPRPSVEGALARDAVVVTVSRHVVAMRPCAEWRRNDTADTSVVPSSHYGCATLANFGGMVANPADLLRGQPTTPADADFATRGVQRYRQGEISKSLKPELPKLSGSGSGGK